MEPDSTGKVFLYRIWTESSLPQAPRNGCADCNAIHSNPTLALRPDDALRVASAWSFHHDVVARVDRRTLSPRDLEVDGAWTPWNIVKPTTLTE